MSKDYGHYPVENKDTFDFEIDQDKLVVFLKEKHAWVLQAFNDDLKKYTKPVEENIKEDIAFLRRPFETGRYNSLDITKTLIYLLNEVESRL